ncbi:MAG: YfhO family protein [Oscillospiraceae bacterium]|nr:YfhO family protein [Oscillospiraceae bacterium]
MQINIKESRRNSYALAFGLPIFAMMIVTIIASAEPLFNLRSMLYSDMYHQYYPFFVEFRNALRSGDSLLYTWSVGLGMDYLSLISYYLGSPLNLLSVLIPESLTLEYFSLLMPIKLGLASLFFAIFLNRIFGREDYSIGLFGCFYGMCAWALGFQWNVMWLDTFALLPLLTLGTIYLLRDKKFILYTVTLFLSVAINYYIGFFVCIFVLLLFFVYQICRWKGFGRFFADLVRIGFFTIIAIGMTAIITLPAFAGLQSTQSSVNAFPNSFRLNIVTDHSFMGLLDAMRQVAGNMMGGGELNFKEGLPNIYCGVGTVIFGILFLTSRDVKLRDKLCSVGLLLFFMVSFIIRQLDYIWHGFHFTNMIPYRFSFLFSFVLLYMAYRAWTMKDSFQVWQILLAGFCGIGLTVISGQQKEIWYIIFNDAFLMLYLLILIFQLPGKAPAEGADEELVNAYTAKTEKNRRLGSWALLAVMVVELGMNVLNFGLRFSYTTVSNYPKGTKDAETVIAQMHEREKDNLFFRAETTHSQTLNDGALNGYYGVSTFTSSANVKTTEFMRALGYGAKNTYNRYCYEESSPVANLFLGLKYMLERDGDVEENDYFDIVASSGEVYLLENNAYLPLGFLANSELADVEFQVNDYFRFQNQLFSAATGVVDDVWRMVRAVNVTGEKVTIDSVKTYECHYSDAESGGKIIYEFTADQNGFLCLDFDVTDRNSYSVYLNDELLYSETLSLRQMIAACNVGTGDVVKVVLKCKSGEDGRTTVKAAILSGSFFRTGHEILKASTLELTHFSNTRVAGTIDCNRDGLLYASIPQDGNWKVYVDGVQVEETLVGDCMIGVMMQKGHHEVEYVYENPAFSFGWKISLVFGLVFLVSVLAVKNRKPGKYEKRS